MEAMKLGWFYHSKAWERTRREYIKTTNGLCERCQGLGIYRAGKIVHHRIPLTDQNVKDESISLNFENLMLVCHECHEEIHKGKQRFMWRADGKIVEQ